MNRIKLRTRRALRPALGWLIHAVPGLNGAVQRFFFPRDLRQLHDVLSATSLAERYSVWGGLLLGWARESGLLAHDMDDADFLVLSEDERLLQEAVPALVQAGYRASYRYRNNEGRVTEYSFQRHGARFDFFLLFPTLQPGVRSYFSYAKTLGRLVELEGNLIEQPLEHFDFLGRKWLKAASHSALLTEIYGHGWRTPDPSFSALNEPSIIACRPWTSTDHSWT